MRALRNKRFAEILEELHKLEEEAKKDENARKALNKMMATIQRVFDHLKYDYLIILKEVFFMKGYEFDWVDRYPVSTYFRLRAQAIDSFVYLYDIFK